MITETQLPPYVRAVIEDQISIYNRGRSITVQNCLPDTNDIPIENPKHWLKIPDVICVFVDMKSSTRLSATTHDQSTAGAYQLFTGTAVRLFDELEAPYIDVRGDGVFALFNRDQPYRAFVAAVTFKTFVHLEFVPRLKEKSGISVGSHIGIDQKTVLVRKIGLKRYGGRSDRQNEVWAGKPVNMAAKLASLSDDNELYVSDRFYRRIQNKHVRKSCGCPSGEHLDLWTEIDVSDDERFDFDKAYKLGTNWCSTHGRTYFDTILALDNGT